MLILEILALLAVASLPYLPSIHGQFIFDDGMLRANGWVQSGEWRKWRKNTFFRPLTYLSYALNVAWFGPVRAESEPPLALAGYHVPGIAIHALNSLILWWAFSFFTPNAYVAALLFAAHPLCSQSVAYVSGRFSAMAGTFCFLGLGLAGGHHFVLASVAVLAACLAKEDAAVFLLVIAAMASWWALAPMIIGAIVFWQFRDWARWLIKSNGNTQMVAAGFPASLEGWTYRATSVTEHLIRLPFWAIGHWQGIDPEIPTFSLKRGMAAVASLGVLSACFFFHPAGPLAALLIFVPLLPYFIISMPDPVMEQRLYLTTAGLALLLSGTPYSWVLVLPFALMTLARSWYWRTPLDAWHASVRDGGRLDRGFTNIAGIWSWRGEVELVRCQSLGLPLSEEGISLYRTAAQYAEQALAVSDRLAIPRTTLAMSAWRTGDTPRGIREMRVVLEQCPEFYHGWNVLGMMHKSANQVDLAIAAYERCLELWPAHAFAANEIGLLWISRKNTVEAEKYFERAAAADVHSIAYRFNYAMTLGLHGNPAACAAEMRKLPQQFPQTIDMVTVTQVPA